MAKRRPGGSLTAVYNCLKSIWSGDRVKLCWVVADDATSGNDHKPQHELFRLDMIKQNSTAGQQQSRLPRELVQSLFLKVFKTELDKAG